MLLFFIDLFAPEKQFKTMSKSIYTTIILASLIIVAVACNNKTEEKEIVKTEVKETKKTTSNDKRISLELMPRQKQHQLKNMRSHLKAVQDIIALLAEDNYDSASAVAYSELGSTTEMKLMCASFGNKDFENLGLDFHASADTMSDVFKTRDKKKSLEALAITMNYCVSCHAAFRQ